MSAILCVTIRYSLAGEKHQARALLHSYGDPCSRHCFHKSWSCFCLSLYTYLIVPMHSFNLTTHTIACSVLCSNTCLHICRSYCLELSPESRWSPAVSLCALVHPSFLSWTMPVWVGCLRVGRRLAGKLWAAEQKSSTVNVGCSLFPLRTTAPVLSVELDIAFP